jgi:SAM-dependent methyltransferase
MRNSKDGPARRCPACDEAPSGDAGQMNGWQMDRCVTCGLIYARAIPSADQIGEIYAQAYRPGQMYDMHLKKLQEMIRTGRSHQGFYRNRLFLKRFKPNQGDRLLEVGCGIGSFMVAARLEGWEVEGIDVSSEALAVSAPIHGLPVRHGTLDSLHFAPNHYKAIVCWEVLEHLVSPRNFMAQARRLLRDDGIFACSVPNNGTRVPALPHDRWGPTALPPVHLNFWDRASFGAFVDANGFQSLHLAPKRSLLGMAAFKNRPWSLLLNQIGALLSLREGEHLYAILAPRKQSVDGSLAKG